VNTGSELSDELEALKREVQVLKDKEAIRDVLSRYALLFDLGSYDKWYELWMEDATFSTGEPEKYNNMNGKAAIKANYGTVPKQHRATQHMQIACVIKVDGDTATAIGYQVITAHRGTAGEAPIVAKTGVRSWTFQRSQGKWLIKKTVSRTMKDLPACLEIVPKNL
jgi:hypothetical protein